MASESLELAKKLRQCMDEAHMTPAELAERMGVKAPSVYDWMNYGRIAKGRLPGLARIFNRPLSWWIDAEDEAELLNDHERQLLVMFRRIGPEARDKLLQEANWLDKQANPEKSVFNPFPKVGRPPAGGRSKKDSDEK